eukprot:scaffold7707_cov133-Isochrysis_galbana.AAC.2
MSCLGSVRRWATLALPRRQEAWCTGAPTPTSWAYYEHTERARGGAESRKSPVTLRPPLISNQPASG